MKARYLSLVIATVLSSNVVAAPIQELATSEVKAKSESTTTVTTQELENIQVNDLKGTLSKFVGVSVSNSSRYSQKTYLRGVEEHSANVTLDGARQDGQMFHHSGNQMIDASMLKAVSVELGAASVLSGYGANVGTIAYETKDPTDLLAQDQKFGFKASVAADTATHYRQVNLAAYGLLTDKLGVLAIINKDESGDIETPDADPIVNKHGGLKSGLVKVVYDFNDNEQLDVSVQHFNDSGHRALSGEKPGVSTIEQALGFNGYERDTLTANYYNHSENPLLDLSVTAYFNEKRMVRGSSTGTNWFRDDAGKWHKDGVAVYPEREYSYKTIGLNIRNTLMVNDIPVTVGLESFKSEQAIGTSGLKQITLKNGTKQSSDIGVYNGPTASLIGGYVQAEFMIGALQIIPGIRFDSYSVGGTYDDSFSQASPKLAAKWQVNDDLHIKFGYGRIFKGPGLPETLMISDTLKQSADVKAETGNHVEFNVGYDLQRQLNVDTADIFVNIYQYTIDNYYHPTKNTSLGRNRIDLTMSGIEAGFKFANNDLNASISYSYNDGENDMGTHVKDHSYSGTHVLKVGANYSLTPLLLVGWNSYFASKAELVDRWIEDGKLISEDVNKKGYGVTNLWLNYQAQNIEGLSLKLAVENAFDKAYQNHNSFGMYWGNEDYNDNEVGRNFKLSISYQY